MRSPLVYLTVLVVATCGLIYELVAGTLASRYVQRGLARRFVEVELSVAVLGGASAPILFLSFGYLPQFFRVALYGVVLMVGTLVGLEIPLVLRILRESVDFKELVAKVLTFDYLGALVASLLFPILLVPHLGLVRTSLLFGLASAAVGLWSTRTVSRRWRRRASTRTRWCSRRRARTSASCSRAPAIISSSS